MGTNKKSQDLSLREFDGDKTKTTILKLKKIKDTEWIIIDLFSKKGRENQKCMNARARGRYIFGFSNQNKQDRFKKDWIYCGGIPIPHSDFGVNFSTLSYEHRDKFINLTFDEYMLTSEILKRLNLKFNKKKGVFVWKEKDKTVNINEQPLF